MIGALLWLCWTGLLDTGPSSLCASITKLAVKEKYRRQGHGEALLSAAMEKCRARNVHRISLHVDPSRTAALNLYKKFGFKVDSLIERYYSSVLPSSPLISIDLPLHITLLVQILPGYAALFDLLSWLYRSVWPSFFPQPASSPTVLPSSPLISIAYKSLHLHL